MTPLDRNKRFTAIKDIGCICCRIDLDDLFSDRGFVACDVHHLLTTGLHGNGERIGDQATIGACQWHHQGRRDGYGHARGPSYAKQAAQFRKVYGTDAQLLALQDRLIARVTL